MLHHREDAIDMVHGLFTDLIAQGVVPPDLPYLYRAVTNRCLTWMRDEKNRSRLRELHLAHPESTNPSLDTHAISADLVAKLASSLEDDVMSVVICRYIDDMTQDEIATHLGVSRKTVGRKLDRARHALEVITTDAGGAA